MERKKIVLLGSFRHGKDTVAEYMKELFDYTFESSSQAASRIFLYNRLKDKYGYKSPKECFEDRVNHRQEWYELICYFNRDNKASLAKEIMRRSDIYVGMRDNEELEESLRQSLFDIVIGVYNPRLPLEDRSSFNIDIWEKSDIIIPNAEGLEELKNRVLLLKPLLIDEEES